MTRISKLQAAGYIWKVSHANDIKFYAPSDLMPSYIAADKKKAADDKDREYRVMCTQVEKARKELEKCEKDVSVKTDRMTEAQKKYDAAVDRFNIAQNDFAKLEDVKDDYINNRKTEDESKRYYAQVIRNVATHKIPADDHYKCQDHDSLYHQAEYHFYFIYLFFYFLRFTLF